MVYYVLFYRHFVCFPWRITVFLSVQCFCLKGDKKGDKLEVQPAHIAVLVNLPDYYGVAFSFPRVGNFFRV